MGACIDYAQSVIGEITQSLIQAHVISGACLGGGAEIEKQKKRSSEQILTYILLLF